MYHLVQNIDHNDEIMISLALETLHNYLFAGKTHPKTTFKNYYADQFMQLGIAEKLQAV